MGGFQFGRFWFGYPCKARTFEDEMQMSNRDKRKKYFFLYNLCTLFTAHRAFILKKAKKNVLLYVQTIAISIKKTKTSMDLMQKSRVTHNIHQWRLTLEALLFSKEALTPVNIKWSSGNANYDNLHSILAGVYSLHHFQWTGNLKKICVEKYQFQNRHIFHFQHISHCNFFSKEEKYYIETTSLINAVIFQHAQLLQNRQSLLLLAIKCIINRSYRNRNYKVVFLIIFRSIIFLQLNLNAFPSIQMRTFQLKLVLVAQFLTLNLNWGLVN